MRTGLLRHLAHGARLSPVTMAFRHIYRRYGALGCLFVFILFFFQFDFRVLVGLAGGTA